MTHPLARAVRAALAAHADPVKAPEMQRYMKSAMPYYGVSAPVQRRLWREVFAAIPMYEEMIVSGAWWDYVDAVATHQLGDVLRNEPRRMKPLMRRWARATDCLWKRRAAILCQIRFRDVIDLDLLYDCIEPNLSHTDFFIRKAIGWARRQHAWTDPREVKRYVRAPRTQLSPLSVREALKNL